jgi:hypothetical protein
MNHTLTDDHFLTFRYGYEKNHRENDQLEFCGASCTAAGIQDNKLWSLLLNHTWIATQSALNEFMFQYSSFENSIIATDPSPTLHFPNLTLGANSNTDQATIQKKYQFKDDFSLHAGNHDWKAGVDWIHSPFLGGDFPFGTRGSFYYSVDDPNAPATYFFTFAGNAAFNRDNDQVGVYLQDDWALGDKLIVNLGVRYDVEFGTFDVPPNIISDALKQNPAGRQNAGIDNSELRNDVDNIAPRLGFAWDVRGNGKTIVRGGWGMFYDQIFLNTTLFDDFLRNNPPFVGIGIPSPTFGPGNIPDLSEFLVPSNGILRVTSPDFETPYTVQTSVGVSQQIGDHMAIDVDFVNADGHHEFGRRNINTPRGRDGQPIEPPISDDFGIVRMMESTGESDYMALQMGFRGRWEKFGFNVAAHIADAEVDRGDFFERPQNNVYDNSPDHTSKDRGAPGNDGTGAANGNLEDWRLVLSGIYQLPLDFQISGIMQIAAARHYSELWGFDYNGDRVTNDRVHDRGNLDGDQTFITDLRFGKFFKFGKSMNVEASIDIFNVFDTVNFGSNYDGRRYLNGTRPDPPGGAGTPGTPNPAFGEPTGTSTTPRQIQLGLRFNW